MSDSDASTVDPEDLEDTIPLDPSELRAFSSSPDLFSDYPVPAVSKDKDVEKLAGTSKATRDSEKKSAEGSFLLKPSASKTEKLLKRRSKVHEISDSGSDTDEERKKNTVTTKTSSEIKQETKEIKSDDFHRKPYKKDYSKPYESSSDTRFKEKDKIDKQQFIKEFLNMGSDDTDDASQKQRTDGKLKKKKTEVCVASNGEKQDKKVVKEKESMKKVHKQTIGVSEKKEMIGAKIKQNAAETHSDKNRSLDSVTVSLKRKSSSLSPTVLKKMDTEIVGNHENGDPMSSWKPACKYGSKCYRKNPSHRQEFSHPDVTEPSTSTGRESPPTKKVKVRESPPLKSRSSSPKATAHPGTPKTIGDKFSQAQPYSFFLTRVSGISDKFNTSFVMDIKDILSPEMGNITASCQFNYMFDVEWLMKQYPPPFRSKPVLLVHGEQGPSKAALQAQAINYSNVKFCQAKLEMMFGTHHTKMMLLLYENGLRVVIHTSNLIQQDWFQKTQGIWISPVFPKLPSPSKTKGDSPTHFKRDLIDYLAAYKAYQLQEWIEHLASHDMSEARAVIIGSVPGRHTTDKNKWGHLKLRSILQEHGPSQATVKTWPVIGQFSSIGSLGANKDQWLCGEWLESLSAAKSSSSLQSKARLQLVFPTKDNVRLSLEGFPAGGSIPYSVNTAKKQTWLHDFFHIWKSECRGRSRAMPHIKTFLRPAQDGKKISWFLVTSANLSKAAWGAFEKKGAQLMIRSYEIGVLFLPKFFDKDEMFTAAEDIDDARSSDHLLLPYDLPPSLYKKTDRPWMWDIPYMDLPDTNGNMWCPFSK